MLGFCDLDDPTNLPVGLAAVCKNAEFGLTSVTTRSGHNLTSNGVAAGIQALYSTPITGLLGALYTPENAAESFYQLPLLSQTTDDGTRGSLQGEFAVGSGSTKEITSSLVIPPANAHMIATQAYNKAWMAWSDLISPKANPSSPTPGMGVLNLETLKYGTAANAFDPYGMKPFGWTWLPSTECLVGEVSTPTKKNVNGHLYHCTTAGITGTVEPTWPTMTGGTVNDGTIVWTEMTPTFDLVYECYPPSPTWTTMGSSGGDWPVGPDGNAMWIYFAFSYVTSAGETDLAKAFIGLDTPSGGFYSGGPPATGSQSYALSCPTPASAPGGYPGNAITGWNLYVALADSGATGLPDPLTFSKVNATTQSFGSPITVTGPGTHGAPPMNNTAVIIGAGNIDAAETVSGLTYIPGSGLSGSLYEFGIRYASVMFVNRNFSVSGFTQASAIPVQIFYNGSTLKCTNIPPGPANTIARIVTFTNLQFDETDPNLLPQYPLGERWAPKSIGTSAGPYFYIGNFVPTSPDYFVYPQTTPSDGFTESSTIFGDNTTTAGHFSYTEPFLIADNDATDRLRVIWPYSCVDIYYSPTNDRMIQTGVPGFNGHWISLAADPESYYVDSGFVPTNNNLGERAICAREFRGTLYSLRERSGFTMTLIGVDDVGNAEWDVQQRWDKVGPCGPRAIDVCGRFMIFVHRSGIYKYSQEEPEPVFVSKELNYWWDTINWAYAQFISVTIDEEERTVRINVPVGESTVPNQEILLYFEEGWNTPIHFSTFSGHEISMDSARRFAINDVAAFIGARVERNIPSPPPNDEGDEGITLLGPNFYTNQYLYGSSGPDGAVMAITPGIYHDGESPTSPGIGIDSQYETMSGGMLLPFCKIEGFSLNARGNGKLYWAFISGRHQLDDWTPAGSPEKLTGVIVGKRPIDLIPNQHVGDSRMVSSKFGERWRLHFSNGKVKDSWFDLKFAVLYAVPFSSDRPQSQNR